MPYRRRRTRAATRSIGDTVTHPLKTPRSTHFALPSAFFPLYSPGSPLWAAGPPSPLPRSHAGVRRPSIDDIPRHTCSPQPPASLGVRGCPLSPLRLPSTLRAGAAKAGRPPERALVAAVVSPLRRRAPSTQGQSVSGALDRSARRAVHVAWRSAYCSPLSAPRQRWRTPRPHRTLLSPSAAAPAHLVS